MSLKFVLSFSTLFITIKNFSQPNASFKSPDTVCVNTPFTITNTSSNASTYYWNFCNANLNATPNALNMGNIGSSFKTPVFMDYTLDNGNYYAFVINHNPGGIVRLDFGNSLLNTPTAVSLGNIGGALNNAGGNEGVQLIKQNGNYFLIEVGGSSASSTTPKLVIYDFGSNIQNTNPSVQVYTGIGGMDEPIDLYIFQESNKWYGYTVNAVNNTLTMFDFGTSFLNAPIATNLGNPNNLFNYATGLQVINDNGFWRMFVTNALGNSDLIRLDFGTSLINTPSAINLGNPGNVLKGSRDIIFNYDCSNIVAYVVGGGNNDISRLNFSSFSSIPSGTNLGNIGNFSLPHCLTRLFRSGNSLYSFVLNAYNNTITRLQFPNCSNASILNSTSQTPPQISYNSPGVYNINLTIDEGLPTQNSFCKQIVVKDCSSPPNPNCKGVIQLTKTSKITPPTPIKKYIANTGFTWECWFNSSYYANSNTTINTRNKIMSVLDAPQCQDIVLGFGWPQVAQQNELCFVADGPNGCTDRDNNPCKYFPSGGFIPNTWYHVAAVRDYTNNFTKLYVNGILVDSQFNNHGALNPTILPFFGIGSYTGLIDSGFAGKLDEIRIWNYPRTATQVQNNYNKCLDGNETGLVTYYHSNEGKGTTLKDASPNANNATLSSSVTWDKTDNAPLTSTCYQSTFAATVNKTICNGQTYLGHNTSGVYNDTTTNSYGCDSISTLNLTVLPAPTTTKDTISSCGQVIINGNTYTSNTIVSTSIKNQLGCDSVLQQHQVLITSKKDTTTIQLCSGQKFWNHTSTFDTTLKTITNCDSNLHIILTFTPFIIDSVTKTICKGDTLKGHFTAGIYRDTTRTGNCDTIHIINLIVRNITPSLQQDSSICEGDFVNLYPGNYKKYVWSNGSTSSSIKAKNIGLYWVEVTDSFGCKGKDSFVLMNVYSKPANFMPSNIQACVGELYTVNGYTNYNWITGETTPAINLNGLPTYWLQVSNSYGCVGSDTMKVVYLNNLSMQLVTAFSPNGDGINDEFKPFSSSCILQYQLSIFNRWGQKVFQTQNPNKAWNGMLNNKPLPTDVYYYIITYKTITGDSQTKSGYITLLR